VVSQAIDITARKAHESQLEHIAHFDALTKLPNRALLADRMQQADFVARLQAILAKHPQVQPGCLELEVLETSALNDMAQVSQVIAEGVETTAHGTALLQLGCELAQGYGIARPMPPEQLPAWAANWQPAAAWAGALGDQTA